MTSKQVEFHLKRLYYRWGQLQKALNEAHEADVIEYPSDQYSELAPCSTHWQTRERFEAAIKDQLAECKFSELRKRLIY